MNYQQVILTLLISVLVPLLVAYLTNRPAYKAAKDQERTNQTKADELEERITERILQRADRALKAQEERHQKEIDAIKSENELLNRKYNIVIEESSIMANNYEALKIENRNLKTLLEDQQREHESALQRMKQENEILRARVRQLEERVGTDKLKRSDR